MYLKTYKKILISTFAVVGSQIKKIRGEKQEFLRKQMIKYDVNEITCFDSTIKTIDTIQIYTNL